MNEEGHPMRMGFSMVKGFTKTEIKTWAEDHIEPKSLVISDGSAYIKSVETANQHHLKIVTGGGAQRIRC